MQARGYLDLIDQQTLAGIARVRGDEYDDLLHLLLEHAANADDDTIELAGAVAQACLGNNHLWQDLGLPSRQELSDLLREHFPTLFLRNSGNMRWKKFFYLQLCEMAEIRACRAPSCDVCATHAECFGSEDTPLKVMQAAVVLSAH